MDSILVPDLFNWLIFISLVRWSNLKKSGRESLKEIRICITLRILSEILLRKCCPPLSWMIILIDPKIKLTSPLEIQLLLQNIGISDHILVLILKTLPISLSVLESSMDTQMLKVLKVQGRQSSKSSKQKIILSLRMMST